MALPDLLLPGGFPSFSAGTHQIDIDSLYAPVPRQTGLDRVRRVWTNAPRTVNTQLELSQSQLEAFHQWYENLLVVGSVPFSAQIAKLGPGTEWWKAYVLEYTGEHREGNLHVVSLKLRLVGEPSATGPNVQAMTTEMFVSLLFQVGENYAMALATEAVAALDFAMTVNESLLTEMQAFLVFEADGASTTHQLIYTEAEAYLEFLNAVESPEMATEASVALDFEVVPDGDIATELTASLSFAVEYVGYVASPGDFIVSADDTALIEVLSDGQIRSKEDFAGYVTEALWYTPATSGIGTGLWVRATVDAGSAPSGASTGVWLSLATSPRTWQRTTNGTTELTISVALDPDGISVVSTFTADLGVT